MTRDSTTHSGLLALYDDLLQDGSAPDPEAFCADYPEHPGLLDRIRALERLRADLRRLAGGAPAADDTEPPVIDGFEILRPLGRGGMGVVYLAEQESPHRYCALKIIHHRSSAAFERFTREADLAARLSHPGIATVYASGEQDGWAYLATEYVHGFSLRDLLQTADLVAPGAGGSWIVEALQHVSDGIGSSSRPTSPGPVPTMVALAGQVAEALAHAHERGVIHRDVKPSNIMVTFDGTAKLIDFGIAVPEDDLSGRVTRTGTFVGTHDYAAPEQLRGETAGVGSWTDTYALGATIFEMVTLHTPFESATFADRLAEVDAVPMHSPRHYNARVPSALDALVMRALHPIAERRFHDGRELADALASCPTRSTLFSLPSTGRLRRLGATTRAHGIATAATLVAFALGLLYLGERDAGELERMRATERARRSARMLLDWQLEDLRGELEGCIPPVVTSPEGAKPLLPVQPPTRLEASLVVEAGEVRTVEVTDTYGMSPRARRCLIDLVSAVPLPGVGIDGPLRLSLTLRVTNRPSTPPRAGR